MNEAKEKGPDLYVRAEAAIRDLETAILGFKDRQKQLEALLNEGQAVLEKCQALPRNWQDFQGQVQRDLGQMEQFRAWVSNESVSLSEKFRELEKNTEKSLAEVRKDQEQLVHNIRELASKLQEQQKSQQTHVRVLAWCLVAVGLLAIIALWGRF